MYNDIHKLDGCRDSHSNPANQTVAMLDPASPPLRLIDLRRLTRVLEVQRQTPSHRVYRSNTPAFYRFFVLLCVAVRILSLDSGNEFRKLFAQSQREA